jgi:hypothetical protein
MKQFSFPGSAVSRRVKVRYSRDKSNVRWYRGQARVGPQPQDWRLSASATLLFQTAGNFCIIFWKDDCVKTNGLLHCSEFPNSNTRWTIDWRIPLDHEEMEQHLNRNLSEVIWAKCDVSIEVIKVIGPFEHQEWTCIEIVNGILVRRWLLSPGTEALRNSH